MNGPSKELAVAAVISTVLCCSALAADVMVHAELEELFEAQIKDGSPGFAVAVVQDGKIVFNNGYGLANLEHDIPITPASVFYLGSVSKQFVAASIVLLEKEGKLSLDDDVRKHIPELRDYGTTITIRHLVHHTSGIRDYLSLMSLAGLSLGHFHDDGRLVDFIARQKGLNFIPGEEYLYSNSGYFLLNVIVQRAGGQTLREFAAERIFEPLGMKDTHFHDDHQHVIRNRAWSYLPWSPTEYKQFVTSFDRVGSGGVFSTTEDLARWDANLYDGTVGGKILVERLHERGRLNDGEQLDYAFGLVHGEYRGQPTVAHGGALGGYRSTFVRFPEQRFSVIVLANLSTVSPDDLAFKTADLYLAEVLAEIPEETTEAVEPVEVSKKELERVTGSYWNAADRLVRRIYLKDDALSYWRSEQSESELAPLGEDRFRMLGLPQRVDVSFRSARDGRPVEMVVDIEGQDPVLFEFYVPAKLGEDGLAAYAGTYYSDELDAKYELLVKNGKLVARGPDYGEMQLDAVMEDLFTARGATLEFSRDAEHGVVDLTLDVGRARNIIFERMY